MILKWASPPRPAGRRLDAWNLKHHSFRTVFLQWTCKSYSAAGRAALWAISPSPSPSFWSNYCNSCSSSVCVLSVQAENSALSMENDNQRKQYERCLDEVSVPVLTPSCEGQRVAFTVFYCNSSHTMSFSGELTLSLSFIGNDPCSHVTTDLHLQTYVVQNLTAVRWTSYFQNKHNAAIS